MGRKILAVVTALIASIAIIWLGWMISTLAAFSTPSQLEHITQDEVNRYAASAPTSFYIIGLVAYALAAFAGGFIVTKMSRRWTTGGFGLTIVVAAILEAWAIIAYLTFPGPIWFLIAAVLLFFPMAALGHRVAYGRSNPHMPETA
jgi:hypothetical protein